MPLSPPVQREHIHTRVVECRGYRRADGLWDIEGHLRDTKSYGVHPGSERWVPSGYPIHEMWMRLVVDDEMTIRDVEAVTDHAPHPMCPAITPNFKRIIGLSMTKGFLRKMRAEVGGIEGCTHLVELIGPLATTAFQTIFSWRERQNKRAEPHPEPGKRPPLLGSCHSYASDSDVVKRLWPEFYTGA